MDDVKNYCPECGMQGLVRKIFQSKNFEECDICGYISGDSDVTEYYENLQEANSLNIEIKIYPLVKKLNNIKGINTFDSCQGHPEDKLWPYVDFYLTEHFEKHLTNLVTMLALTNHETQGKWFLEPFIHTALAFSLRPHIPLDSTLLTPEFIVRLQNDIPRISHNLLAHQNLAWWRK